MAGTSGTATRPSMSRSTSKASSARATSIAAGATTRRSAIQKSTRRALPERAVSRRLVQMLTPSRLKITKLAAWKSGASRRWTSQSVFTRWPKSTISRAWAIQRPSSVT